MPFAPSISGLTRRVKLLDTLLSTRNRMLKELEIIPSILLQFGESSKKAQQRLPKWGTPPSENRAILGTADDCLRQIVEYHKAGATHLALRLVNPDESQKTIQIIAQEILPNL
jgi:alkanesulfonate monooxygenase SsuD/methylene tetrahydromethanopterin reductase-like flavin-dependent oxidoreductase (luciferase family)